MFERSYIIANPFKVLRMFKLQKSKFKITLMQWYMQHFFCRSNIYFNRDMFIVGLLAVPFTAMEVLNFRQCAADFTSIRMALCKFYTII